MPDVERYEDEEDDDAVSLWVETNIGTIVRFSGDWYVVIVDGTYPDGTLLRIDSDGTVTEDNETPNGVVLCPFSKGESVEVVLGSSFRITNNKPQKEEE